MARPPQRPEDHKPRRPDRETAELKLGIARHLLDTAAAHVALEFGISIERARTLIVKSVHQLDRE